MALPAFLRFLISRSCSSRPKAEKAVRVLMLQARPISEAPDAIQPCLSAGRDQKIKRQATLEDFSTRICGIKSRGARKKGVRQIVRIHI